MREVVTRFVRGVKLDSWMPAIAAGMVLVLVVIPQLGLLGTYGIGLLVDIMILGLYGLSFNLLFGYTGLLSFGHSAFFGGGAYLFVLMLAGKLPVIPTIDVFVGALVFGVIATVIIAAVFGLLSVQRSDLFFAMLTLALSMMLYELANQWSDVTGGANGTTIPPSVQVDLGVVSFSIFDTTMYYYFTLAIVVVSVLTMLMIVRSPYGELLTTIRENPERAAFIGIPVKRYQWTAFVVSGTFAGIAGALASVRAFVVSPELLHWSVSAEPILVTLLGGPTTFFGPVLGAIIFVFLEVFLSGMTNYWQIVIGVILIPIVLFAPDGLLGTAMNWREDR